MKAFPTLRSSKLAYDFASSFCERTTLGPNKNIYENSQPPVAPEVTEEGSQKGPKETPQEGPSKIVGQIDYKKWEDMEKSIKLKEVNDEELNKREQEYEKNMIPGCSHDHSKERQMFERPISEQLNASQRFNEEGNLAFGQKNFGLAALNYRKAIVQSDYCFPEKEDDLKHFNNIKLNSLLNLSACKLHQKDFNEVLILCRQALEIDSCNPKALFRMGSAYLAKHDFKMANNRETYKRQRNSTYRYMLSAPSETNDITSQMSETQDQPFDLSRQTEDPTKNDKPKSKIHENRKSKDDKINNCVKNNEILQSEIVTENLQIENQTSKALYIQSTVESKDVDLTISRSDYHSYTIQDLPSSDSATEERQMLQNVDTTFENCTQRNDYNIYNNSIQQSSLSTTKSSFFEHYNSIYSTNSKNFLDALMTIKYSGYLLFLQKLFQLAPRFAKRRIALAVILSCLVYYILFYNS